MGNLFRFSFVLSRPRYKSLQFADDTLVIGEKSDKNVCIIKVILQLFELVLGLNVNFHKVC